MFTKTLLRPTCIEDKKFDIIKMNTVNYVLIKKKQKKKNQNERITSSHCILTLHAGQCTNRIERHV
jgi:hypothetical protein